MFDVDILKKIICLSELKPNVIIEIKVPMINKKFKLLKLYKEMFEETRKLKKLKIRLTYYQQKETVSLKI